MTTPTLLATDAEVIELGDGPLTLGVVIDHGRLLLVLRDLTDTDVVVPCPDHRSQRRDVHARSDRFRPLGPPCAALPGVGSQSGPATDRSHPSPPEAMRR